LVEPTPRVIRCHRSGTHHHPLQAVDHDLLVGAVHALHDGLRVGPAHHADHARAHRHDADLLAFGNVDLVEALLHELGSVAPAGLAEVVNHARVEGTVTDGLREHAPEFARTDARELRPVAVRDEASEASVVCSLGVHREHDVAMGALENVSTDGLLDHDEPPSSLG